MGSGGDSNTFVIISVRPPPVSMAPENSTIPFSGGRVS